MQKQLIFTYTQSSFCAGILLMLGLYLLYSERSAFHLNIRPNLVVRKAMGRILLFLSLTFSPVFLLPLVCEKESLHHIMNTVIMLSYMAVPAIMIMMRTLLQFQTKHKRYLPISLVIPIIGLIWYCIHTNNRIIYFVSLYWFIFILINAISIIKKEHLYRKKLQNLYADIEIHNLKWINQFFTLFFFYFIFFMIAFCTANAILYALSYICCSCLWTFAAIHVDYLSVDIQLWKDKDENELVEDKTDTDHTLSEVVTLESLSNGKKHSTEERDLSWIGERLHERCEIPKLYLNHDINIDMLSKSLCTNRTYISQYLASQGTTYNDYINKLRIVFAKELMDTSEEKNLSEIAFRSGFRSISTFRRAFIEREKCSPAEYLNSKGKEL